MTDDESSYLTLHLAHFLFLIIVFLVCFLRFLFLVFLLKEIEQFGFNSIFEASF
jgi:hypothetical protein